MFVLSPRKEFGKNSFSGMDGILSCAQKKADLKTAFISVFYCHAVVLGLNQVTTELGVVEQSQEDRELNFIANQF